VTLLPSELSFGTLGLGKTSASSAVTLTNATSSNISLKSTAVGLDFEIVSTTCSSTLGAGQSCSYELAFRPLTLGSKNEMFKVTDSSSNSPQQVQLIGIAN